jgi:hypothetical protein
MVISQPLLELASPAVNSFRIEFISHYRYDHHQQRNRDDGAVLAATGEYTLLPSFANLASSHLVSGGVAAICMASSPAPAPPPAVKAGERN